MGTALLTVLICLLLYFICPWFYKIKMETGIVTADVFTLWATGAACLLYLSSTGKSVTGKGILLFLIIILYLAFETYWHNFPDSNSFYLIASFISLAAFFSFLDKTKSKSRRITKICLLSAYCLQLFIGFYQAITTRWEPISITGWFANSGYFANYLLCCSPLLLSKVLSGPEPYKITVKKFSLVIFILSGILLISTGARAALLGFIIGNVYVAFPLFLKNSGKMIPWRTSTARLISLAIPAALFLLALYYFKPASAKGRVTIYKVCLHIIKDNTLTGTGPSRFSEVYNNYQSAYFNNKPVSMETKYFADNTFEAFNVILQVLTEYGVVGFALFSVTIFLLAKNAYKAPSAIKTINTVRGSRGCLLAIAVAALFSNPFHCIPILAILIFHLSTITNFDSENITFKVSIKNTMYSITLIIAAACIITYGVMQFVAQRTWKRAAELVSTNEFKEARLLYRKAYPGLKTDGNFLFNYGSELYLQLQYDSSIQILEQAKKYNSFSNLYSFLGSAYEARGKFKMAEENYLQAANIVPSHLYPKYQLVLLYKKWGDNEKKQYWLSKALNEPVKVPSDLTDNMLNDLKRISKE